MLDAAPAALAAAYVDAYEPLGRALIADLRDIACRMVPLV